MASGTPVLRARRCATRLRPLPMDGSAALDHDWRSAAHATTRLTHVSRGAPTPKLRDIRQRESLEVIEAQPSSLRGLEPKRRVSPTRLLAASRRDNRKGCPLSRNFCQLAWREHIAPPLDEIFAQSIKAFT